MSERPLPAHVDARKVFQQEAEISGSVGLERLPRLRNSLLGDQARIEVGLRFHRDDAGRRLISGALQGQVIVQCQRCLEPVTVTLEDDIRLALVESDGEAARLPATLDPCLPDDNKLDLFALVEEQALLCLPIVSFHLRDECRPQADFQTAAVADAHGAGADQNPFAVLKSLKESDESE